MKLFFAIFIMFINPSFSQDFSTGKYGQKYYHIKFKISAQNAIPAFGKTKYDTERNFELPRPTLYIKKEFFPIVATIGHTHSYWMLKFPDLTKYPEMIPILYDPIKKILDTKAGEIEVVLEFHYGYVKEISQKPLKIEVSEIGLTFRMAHGKYIPYLGQLRN